MAFHLRRVSDGKGDGGPRSQAIKWKGDQTFEKTIDYKPTVGCSMLVGSTTARSYDTQDYWLTTIVTEILEEIKNDDVHYIRFKTENSEYEWWNGVHPKNKVNEDSITKEGS